MHIRIVLPICTELNLAGGNRIGLVVLSLWYTAHASIVADQYLADKPVCPQLPLNHNTNMSSVFSVAVPTP